MKTRGRIRFFLLVPANLLALGLAGLGAQARETNLLGWFLLLLGVAYLAGSLVFFLPGRPALIGKPEGVGQEEAGDRSFWLVIPAFVLVFYAAPLEYLYLGGQARSNAWAQAGGVALILLGVILRAWTRLALKEQYTAHVQVQEGQVFQAGGPYRYIRHPGYAGFLLLGLGVAAGFSSHLSGLAVFYILLPCLYYRMTVEEDLLSCQYGDAYLRYAVRTPRLIPGLF